MDSNSNLCPVQHIVQLLVKAHETEMKTMSNHESDIVAASQIATEFEKL